MLTIVFYGRDSGAAKARARTIAANKPNQARVYDALFWGGQNDTCDAVEILPCVPSLRRALIKSVFGEKCLSADQPCTIAQADAVEPAPKRRGGWPKGKPRRKTEAA